MSKVYDKSRLKNNLRYFEDERNFCKDYNYYSLNETSIHDAFRKQNFDYGGKGGVPLHWSGKDRKVFMDHTDAHTLIYGSTGSKKSRLVAIPTVMLLGSSKESMIISDPKAEVYMRTSGYLSQKGYDISIVNLRAPEYGDCWNPLSIPYRFYLNGDKNRAYDFVNDISENLTKLQKSTKDAFWDNSAGSLFFGLVLLLFKYCKENDCSSDQVNIGNLIKLRNDLFGSKKEYLWNYGKEDIHIHSSLIGTMNAANNTRASILSVFDEKMSNFLIKPSLMKMMAENSVPLDSIDTKPTAIFLILPDEKTSHHKLVSLFIKQSYEYLIHRAQMDVEDEAISVGRMQNRVNYILDEFSSLPTIKDFPAMITAARSRNIRFNLFVQSKNQLIERYNSEAETIQSNCSNWIFLTSRELTLLSELSTLCGMTDQERNERQVISIAELQRLDKHKGEALILSGRNKPFISNLLDIDNFQFKFSEPVKMIKRNNSEFEYLSFKVNSQVFNDDEQIDGSMNDNDSDDIDKEENRKKELERIRKWIEERRAKSKESEKLDDETDLYEENESSNKDQGDTMSSLENNSMKDLEDGSLETDKLSKPGINKASDRFNKSNSIMDDVNRQIKKKTN